MPKLPRAVLQQAIDQINVDSQSVDDVALQYDLHPNTVARYVKRGRLPAFKIARLTRIWREDAAAVWK